MTRISWVIVLSALACAPRTDAESARETLQSVDTLKPATTPFPGSESTAAKTAAQSVRRDTGTKSTSAIKTKGDSIIGHDIAIPMDPKKPKLDTVKRRPPQ